MRKPISLTLLALALMGGAGAWAQEALVTKRQTTLREGPADSTAALATLPAQTTLTRQPIRQGPWVQVKTAAGASGWIHLFDVGTATEQGNVASAATGALRGLSNLFNRGSAPNPNTSGTTATVGIRGLGAEDIANAQPNLAALAQAEGLRQDAAQAKRFAADASLSARLVDPLPIPAPPTPATASGPGYSP
ncbi:SH3 domain-containing protein [Rhodoferax sp. TH121]|uniref:SH3 domain-containing protein n=1 Tax=Rhodoferax sp. TH121 TaxID=2022803 RepID=UPI00113FD37F|nr:SH3 domain-containing protein [Rhodoferax sp. TH121]